MDVFLRRLGGALALLLVSFPSLSMASPPERPEAEREQPRLPRGRDMLGRPFAPFHWEAARGALFVRGVSPVDVGQGNLGDCFFLSSLAAVAGSRPEMLKRAIRENRDGTYTVVFRVLTASGSKAVPITVDDLLPAHRRGPAFGHGLQRVTRGEELWPAIFEKAYAAWKGGYHRLNQGGYAEEALAALTGRRVSRLTLSAVREARLWETLKAAAVERRPMVTGTPSAAVLKRLTGRADQMGLIDGHAYAIVGVRERSTGRFVELYTPLTPAQGGVRRGGQSRRVTLPLAAYIRYFDDLLIGR